MPTYSVITSDGQLFGPADDATLVQWVREGRIAANTVLLCHETNTRVVPQAVAALAGLPGIAPVIGVQQLGYANLQVWHALETFSTPAVVVLHWFTLGIFTLIHFQLMHDKLPRNRADDPSAGKAIGFMFIPFFNFYWVFFANLRLLDRIDEQRRAAGLPERSLKGLCLTMLVMTFIPFVNYVSLLIMYPIYFGRLQSNVNELCRATGRG